MSSAIEIKGLKKTYNRGLLKTPVHAVNGLDLVVNRGEIFGFLGPNGAGKSTTINIMMNFMRASAGEARVLGGTMADLKVRDRVGYISENPVFYNYLSGAQNLFFFGKMFGLSNALIKERVERITKQFNLNLELKLPLREHSKGMLQRIGLAQALINDPELLILDEPMSGLDPIGRREFKDVLINLREQGKTVFFSSHILADVEEMCDRVSIVTAGKVIDLFTMEEYRKKNMSTPLEDYFVEKVQAARKQK